MGPELACGHVLDHTPTQRADGGIGTHGELLLSEAIQGPRSFLRNGLPTPMISSQVVSQPSIEHPAQRLSRQRFSALGVERTQGSVVGGALSLFAHVH